jgi:hypothetical protein
MGELAMATDIGIRTILNLSYEQAVQKTTDALKVEGFGVLTQIDVQATLKQKINADFRRYMILGACNPTLAQRALSTNLDVGLLLPCNVCRPGGNARRSQRRPGGARGCRGSQGQAATCDCKPRVILMGGYLPMSMVACEWNTLPAYYCKHGNHPYGVSRQAKDFEHGKT